MNTKLKTTPEQVQQSLTNNLRDYADAQLAISWIRDNREYIKLSGIARAVGVSIPDFHSLITGNNKTSTGKPYNLPFSKAKKLCEVIERLRYE